MLNARNSGYEDDNQDVNWCIGTGFHGHDDFDGI
jgi:hypothetical protein